MNERTVDTTETVEITDFANYIAGSSNTLRIPSDKTLTQNITVPVTCSLQFMNGAKFIHSGNTIEFNGRIIGDPMWQIFSGSGAVTFSCGSIPFVRPEWFGVDYSVDCTGSVQKAINSVASGGVVFMSAPSYTITGPLTNNSGVLIVNHSDTDILGLLDTVYSRKMQIGATRLQLAYGVNIAVESDSTVWLMFGTTLNRNTDVQLA